MAIDPTAAAASITTGVASAQSAGTFAVGQYQVVASAAAWLAVGSNPTAVAGAAGNVFLPAGVPVMVFVGVAASKFAAIQDSGAGKVNICPIVG